MDYDLLRLMFQTTIYHLWSLMNGRKHDQPHLPPLRLAHAVDKVIRNWILSHRTTPHDNDYELLSHWLTCAAPQRTEIKFLKIELIFV